MSDKSIRKRVLAGARRELWSMQDEIHHYKSEFSAAELKVMRRAMRGLCDFVRLLEKAE